jgi:hypothetical protein
MSLGCLTCNTVDGTKSFRIVDGFEIRLQQHSVRSETDGGCLTSCWAKKQQQQPLPQLPPSTTPGEPVLSQGSKVVPLSDEDTIPQLTRCYAVRRDCSFFQNWSVNEVEAVTTQLGQWRCHHPHGDRCIMKWKSFFTFLGFGFCI